MLLCTFKLTFDNIRISVSFASVTFSAELKWLKIISMKQLVYSYLATYSIIMVNMLLAVTTSCGKIASCCTLVMLLSSLVNVISVVMLTAVEVIFCTSVSRSVYSALWQFDTSGEFHTPPSKHSLVAITSVMIHKLIMYSHITMHWYKY